MTKITAARVHDVRFPTSAHLDGSDAQNEAPDYSLAYLVIETDGPLVGHGFTFTIGRGNEICAAAIEVLARRILGADVDAFHDDPGAMARLVNDDSQLRWLGPEKGVVHLATAAVVNALWDLLARSRGVPLWRYLLDLRSDRLAACIDYRGISDVLTHRDVVEMADSMRDARGESFRLLERKGLAAYTTSVGWLGYDDAKVTELCKLAIDSGWTAFKMKVGARVTDDLRRAELIRRAVGDGSILGMDANQVWDVDTAVARIRELAPFSPYWMEEPTHPDDVLGHATIARSVPEVPIATGEHCQNRIVFKQYFQANAIDFCQLDACRLGGVNEVLAVLFMAKKFGVPVCPHAGGVGLSEYVQHVSAFDAIAVGGPNPRRIVEYVDHLHEHFVHPVSMVDGHYRLPMDAGFSAELCPESLAAHSVGSVRTITLDDAEEDRQ